MIGSTLPLGGYLIPGRAAERREGSEERLEEGRTEGVTKERWGEEDKWGGSNEVAGCRRSLWTH